VIPFSCAGGRKKAMTSTLEIIAGKLLKETGNGSLELIQFIQKGKKQLSQI
jgi:hypothetical protein